MELEWDTGTAGCTRLVLGLRRRIDALAPGKILRVIARDAGAVHDLPAWCRMTGNELLTNEPPMFRVRKKTRAPRGRSSEHDHSEHDHSKNERGGPRSPVEGS